MKTAYEARLSFSATWPTIHLPAHGINLLYFQNHIKINCQDYTATIFCGFKVNRLWVQKHAMAQLAQKETLQYLSSYWGKMCAVATITPAGAHTVVSNGWQFVQAKMSQFYVNGTVASGSTYPNWASDSTPTTSSLDSSDKLYLIDAPNLPALNGATSNESYMNLRNVILWGTDIASDTNYYWHWRARQKTSVDLTDLGSGMTTIPTNSFYSP